MATFSAFRQKDSGRIRTRRLLAQKVAPSGNPQACWQSNEDVLPKM
jgi:hypothetical protein